MRGGNICLFQPMDVVFYASLDFIVKFLLFNFLHLIKFFRGNMVDAFRTHIMQTKELGTCPVRQIGGCSFFYMRISNVYIVIVVSSNANVACAFKFVVEVVGIFFTACILWWNILFLHNFDICLNNYFRVCIYLPFIGLNEHNFARVAKFL